jgi:integrase/recombinase XerD
MMSSEFTCSGVRSNPLLNQTIIKLYPTFPKFIPKNCLTLNYRSVKLNITFKVPEFLKRRSKMVDTQQLPLFATNDSLKLSKRTPLALAVEPFQQYLRSEGKTDNTIKGFTSDLNLVCQYLGEDVPVGNLSTRDLNHFLEWLEHGRGQPCSRKSYARRVTTMKVFFKWLKEEKIRGDNPASAIVQRSGPAPLQPALSDHDVNALLDFTNTLRLAEKPDARPDMLVRLLLDTGMKKSEAMNLTADQVVRGDDPHVTVRLKGRRNVYKERHIPVDPVWLDVLDEYIEQYQPPNTLFTCTARNLEYILHDMALGAGVDSKVSFEILRWTSAVRDYLNGMDMDDLREKMGLSRISWRETSQKIVKLAEKQVARQ